MGRTNACDGTLSYQPSRVLSGASSAIAPIISSSSAGFGLSSSAKSGDRYRNIGRYDGNEAKLFPDSSIASRSRAGERVVGGAPSGSNQ